MPSCIARADCEVGRKLDRRRALFEQRARIVAQLLTDKTYAQSEPHIISTLAPRRAIRGIAANGLTQKNACAAGRPRLSVRHI
jgi:hypothetical protein